MEQRYQKENSSIMKREDPRTIRSKRDLANALSTLLQEKHIEQITIQDIVERALISKTTFYNNFKSKEELTIFLLRRSAETLFGEVESYLEHHHDLGNEALFREVIHLVIDFLIASSAPFQEMILHDQSRLVYWSLTSILEDLFHTCLKHEMRMFLNDDLDENVAIYYFAGAFANLIYKKVGSEEEVNVETLVEQVFRMAKPVID